MACCWQGWVTSVADWGLKQDHQAVLYVLVQLILAGITPDKLMDGYDRARCADCTPWDE